jgi:hypothetical protein
LSQLIHTYNDLFPEFGHFGVSMTKKDTVTVLNTILRALPHGFNILSTSARCKLEV